MCEVEVLFKEELVVVDVEGGCFRIERIFSLFEVGERIVTESVASSLSLFLSFLLSFFFRFFSDILSLLMTIPVLSSIN